MIDMAALAANTRTELDNLLPRMRENVIWTAWEIRLAEWLVSKAVIRQTADTVTVIVPSGRGDAKLGYLLYACLERAADFVDVDALEGFSRPGQHGMRVL